MTPTVCLPPRRHQWYQLGGKVVVDVFAKGQRPEDVRVDVTDDDDAGSRLRIVIADTEQQQEQQVAAGAGGGTDYVLELALHGRVLPDAVRTEVLRTKVEVSLTKAVPGQAWPALDRGCQGVGAAGVGVAAGGASASSDGGSGGVARLYPSSKGPKDWGKVEGAGACVAHATAHFLAAADDAGGAPAAALKPCLPHARHHSRCRTTHNAPIHECCTDMLP
jgi:CS domain